MGDFFISKNQRRFIMTIQDRLRSNIVDIKAKYDSGYSMTKLGKEYDCNSGTIHYFLKQYNYLKEFKKPNRTRDCSEKILSLFNSGMSIYKISSEVDIKVSSLHKFLTKQGVNTSRGSTQREKGNRVKDHKDLIIHLYNDGYNQREIAELVECGQSSIHTLLKKEGIQIRNNTIYSVDESYFSNLDTQEKAYILGWMYADGNVTPEGKFRIQIQSGDDYILHWIKEQVKYTGPLYNILPPKKFPHRKNQTCLSINRKVMTTDLIKLGCVLNKSLVLTFPTNDMVPHGLMPHFIRGFFDGDGCISNGAASITSTDSFARDLDKYLIKFVGIEGGKPQYRYEDKNTVSHRFRREDTVKFLNWIYDGSKIHLSRKHNLYQELCV